MAAITDAGVRIWGRDMQDYTDRYPEFQERLGRLPSGTILDGELVVVRSWGRGLPCAHGPAPIAAQARRRGDPVRGLRYALPRRALAAADAVRREAGAAARHD